MNHTLALTLVAGCGFAVAASASAPASTSSQPAVARAHERDDEARPRELQRLIEDAQNLDADLDELPSDGAPGEEFRKRAEEIREDVVYLKVKMRRHQRNGGRGTGVSFDEVSDVRRSIADLRNDIARSLEQQARGRELRVPEGTRVLVRLDEALSSRSARREDRFDASVYRPVRAQGQVAIAAGTRLRGIVKDVEPAQRGSRGARLELDFDTLYFERQRLDVRSRVVSLDQDDSGGNTAGKAGIGAVLGGVVGSILGGKKGAVVGIIVGGTGAVMASKGDEVDLPAGTIVTLELIQALTIEPDPRD